MAHVVWHTYIYHITQIVKVKAEGGGRQVKALFHACAEEMPCAVMALPKHSIMQLPLQAQVEASQVMVKEGVCSKEERHTKRVNSSFLFTEGCGTGIHTK